MKTINSLSGGKTSSYMAYHYPADYNIFSLVKIDDISCTPKDKKLVQYVSDKIGEQFIATAERDSTLYAMRDLEQLIGKEIVWVSGISFDEVVNTKGGFLPSYLRRFCTTEMKVRPIWDWWYKNIGEKVKMGIGYRYDEYERVSRFSTSFKGIVGQSVNGRNKWEEIKWREGYFPLVENKIFHHTVLKWAKSTNIIFPDDSNCIGCFHKQPMQLRKNWDDEPSKMQWFSNQEKKGKGTWREDGNYEQFKKIGLQKDFFFGTGSGCQAGFCTD